MSWECERCGASVDELLQCECCRMMVCTKCYDPFAGSCSDCVTDLFQNKRKCGICRLTQPINYLWKCPYCERRVCLSHLAERQTVCDDCIAEFEKMPDLMEDEVEECTRCGTPMLVDTTTTEYYDRDGNPICLLCAEDETEDGYEEDEGDEDD